MSTRVAPWWWFLMKYEIFVFLGFNKLWIVPSIKILKVVTQKCLTVCSGVGSDHLIFMRYSELLEQYLPCEEFVNSLIRFWLFLSGSNDGVKSYLCITAVSCLMMSHWIPKPLTLALQFYLKQVPKLLFDWSFRAHHTKLMTCNQLMKHGSVNLTSTLTHPKSIS